MNIEKLKSWAKQSLGAVKRHAGRGFGLIWRYSGLCRRQIRRGPLLVKQGEVFYIPLWLPVALAILLASTVIWGDIAQAARRITVTAIEFVQGREQGELAGFFAPSVQYWSGKLDDWAAHYEVDRDLLATVMQIESCGHPSVVSVAGASGLFQVMPFHFAEGEDMVNPDTNALRGASFLNYCHRAADAVVGLTLACYNGGPGVIGMKRESWPRETQKYYRWGVGIYSDAAAGKHRSETLDQWLEAGGDHLCDSAVKELQRIDRRNAPSSS